MTPLLIVGLIGLALVDSTSIGTLFIPVWLLLTPGRVRGSRFAVYLGTIAAFYFVVGVLIAVGAHVVFDRLGEVLADDNDSPALRIPQFFVGAALVVWGLSLGSNKRRERKGTGAGRLTRWRERAMTGTGSSGSLMALAILAAAIELLSMLPYLAGIGLMTAADLGWAGTGLALAAYCLLMIQPATVLITARILAQDRVEPILQRINGWMTKHGDTMLSTTVCGIGFYLAANAVIILFVA